MSQKPHDPEVQSELEVAFDCCGVIDVIFHSDLKQLILDGIAHASAAPDPDTGTTVGSKYIHFWLSPDPTKNLFLDVDFEWNPNAVPQAGALTISLNPASIDCDALVPQNPNIAPPVGMQTDRDGN